MVFRYCFGMTMSVSTLMIFRGAATPSSVVNLSIDRTSRVGIIDKPLRRRFIANAVGIKVQITTMLFLPGLDRLHIAVGQAKMVPDLVNQHMADDMAERLVMFGPIIQDRPAIQPDHVGQPRDIVIAAERQPNALEQAEQVEFALRAHLVENLIGRKIVDADDHALAEVAKALRQVLENVMRHGFHLGERRRFRFCPHRGSLARVPGGCIPVLQPHDRAELTLARQSETLRLLKQLWVGVMKRIRTAALWLALAAGFSLPASGASAQAAPSVPRTAQAAHLVSTQ